MLLPQNTRLHLLVDQRLVLVAPPKRPAALRRRVRPIKVFVVALERTVRVRSRVLVLVVLVAVVAALPLGVLFVIRDVLVSEGFVLCGNCAVLVYFGKFLQIPFLQIPPW